MNAPKDAAPLKSFRESKWRYSQFVLVAGIVAALVKGVSGVAWLPAVLIGAAVGVAYFVFEKRRGVI